jgi:hypothetical protein
MKAWLAPISPPGIGVAAVCTLPQCTETLSPVPGRKRSHSASSDELRSFRCCLIFFGPDRFSPAGLIMRRISMAVSDSDSRAVWAGDRAERGRMLDEFTAMTGFHGKHAMRLRHGRFIQVNRAVAAGMPAGWPSKPLPIRRIISFFKRRSRPREVRPSK